MATKWIILCVLAAIFVLIEAGLCWWASLPDQRGQAMPAFIVPVVLGVLGIGMFCVLALLLNFL